MAKAVSGARASARDMPAGLSPASMSGDAQCSAQKAAANAADAATYTDTTKHSSCHLRARRRSGLGSRACALGAAWGGGQGGRC